MKVYSIGSEYYQRSNGKLSSIYRHAGETAHQLKLERIDWAEIEHLMNRKSRIQILPADDYIDNFFKKLLGNIIKEKNPSAYEKVIVAKRLTKKSA